jgi:hypothetical protein
LIISACDEDAGVVDKSVAEGASASIILGEIGLVGGATLTEVLYND